MSKLNSTTNKQAIYTSMGATEEHLAEAFPKGTKVEISSTVDGSWKSCSIQFGTDPEEYRKRAHEIYLYHPRRLDHDYITKLKSAWQCAAGSIEIEVGDIKGDVVINNLWDAKRYAKQLADRLGWEWEMI
jgi:hypothetical protein